MERLVNLNIEEIKDILFPLGEGNRLIKEMGIFGSKARGEDTRQSDLDIYVDYDEERLNLISEEEVLNLMSFENNLESSIEGVAISLTSIQALKDSGNSEILKEIKKDKVILYAKE